MNHKVIMGIWKIILLWILFKLQSLNQAIIDAEASALWTCFGFDTKCVCSTDFETVISLGRRRFRRKSWVFNKKSGGRSFVHSFRMMLERHYCFWFSIHCLASSLMDSPGTIVNLLDNFSFWSKILIECAPIAIVGKLNLDVELKLVSGEDVLLHWTFVVVD